MDQWKGTGPSAPFRSPLKRFPHAESPLAPRRGSPGPGDVLSSCLHLPTCCEEAEGPLPRERKEPAPAALLGTPYILSATWARGSGPSAWNLPLALCPLAPIMALHGPTTFLNPSPRPRFWQGLKSTLSTLMTPLASAPSNRPSLCWAGKPCQAPPRWPGYTPTPGEG